MSEEMEGIRVIRVAICCYYLNPSEMLRGARRVFRSWKNISFLVYSTNPSHHGPSHSGVSFQSVGSRYNDFSAYARACEMFAEAGPEQGRREIFIFLNDTFLIRHPARTILRIFRAKLSIIEESDAPVLCGVAHTYRALLQTSPLAPGLDQYISTFFFATNWAGIGILQSVFSEPETAVMLEAAENFGGDGIPEKFAAFLRLHLGGGKSVFSWKNARGKPDNGRKAACVLLEHLISARFFQSGFVLPVNSSTLLNGVLLAAYFLSRAGGKVLRLRER